MENLTARGDAYLDSSFWYRPYVTLAKIQQGHFRNTVAD